MCLSYRRLFTGIEPICEKSWLHPCLQQQIKPIESTSTSLIWSCSTAVDTHIGRFERGGLRIKIDKCWICWQRSTLRPCIDWDSTTTAASIYTALTLEWMHDSDVYLHSASFRAASTLYLLTAVGFGLLEVSPDPYCTVEITMLDAFTPQNSQHVQRW